MTLRSLLKYSIVSNNYNSKTKNIVLCAIIPYRMMAANIPKLKYLNQKESTDLDIELFNEYKFSLEQLMELAGLSCAIAVAKVFPVQSGKKVLIVCGPGNNGGDGLVAARHLKLFGYCPVIYYPKRTDKPHFSALLSQCLNYGIDILDNCPTTENINSDYNIVLDALFGFSFKPPVRESMKTIMDAMINTSKPVCCVDIPSGWIVDSGPPESESHITPKLLISLSAPKLCAKKIQNCKHYLGGRFVPPAMQEKYGLNLPEYPGTEQVVEISH